jgi:hypothetical protein
MPRKLLANNAFSTLSIAVSSAGQATLTLQSGHGARFPSPASPDTFQLTLDDGTNVEIVTVIQRAGDVLTVLRGQERTTAQSSFAIGTLAELRLTEDVFRYVRFDSRMSQIGLMPTVGVASWSLQGLRVPTQVGSFRLVALNNSSWRNTQPRVLCGQANSANNPVHWRVPDAVCNVGAGFHYRQRFGITNQPNSSHFFLGLINTTGAVTSVHPPSSLSQAIAIGWTNLGGQGTPPNLSVWRNDNAGDAIRWDLGSNFTANSVAWYEFVLRCFGNTPALECTVRRLDISSIADVSTIFTDNIPTNSAWLSPMMNGTTMVTSGMLVELGPVLFNT